MIRKIKLIFLCFCLVLVPLYSYPANSYASTSESYTMYKGGRFWGKNNQSGAINMYLMNAVINNENTVAKIEFTSSNGNKTTKYWAASNEALEAEGKKSEEAVVGYHLSKMIDPGDAIAIEVIIGSVTVHWPTYSGMKHTFSEGTKEEASEEVREPNIETIDILQELGLDEAYKTGKFLMFTGDDKKSEFMPDFFHVGDDSDDDQSEPADEKSSFLKMMFKKGFSLKDEGLPLSVTRTYNDEDQTITWKIGFPAEYVNETEEVDKFQEYYDSVAAWQKNKNNIFLLVDAVKKCHDYYKDGLGKYDINVSMGGSVLSDVADVFSDMFSPDINAGGFIEIVTDYNNNLISGLGEFGAKFTADEKKTIHQYFSPIGLIVLPWYWELDYNYDGSMAIDLAYKKNNRGKLDEIRTSSLLCEGDINGKAGLGIIGIANIQANLDMHFNLDGSQLPFSKLDIEGSAWASARFLKYYKQNLLGPLEYKLNIWDFDESDLKKDDDVFQLQNVEPEVCLASGEIDSVELTQMSVNVNDGKWQSDLDGNFDITGIGTQGEILSKSSMAAADYKLAKLNDKLIVIFNTQDTDSKAENSGRLFYSVKTDDSWSEPKAVWDNGCSDYFADIKTYGDKIYVVWQKSASSIAGNSSESMLYDAVSKTEICTAEFDYETDSFVNQSYITDNAYLDMMPVFAGGDSPIAAWISNENNSFLGETDSNIYISKLIEGAWTSPEIICRAKGFVSSFVAFENGDHFETLYVSMDMNNYSEGMNVSSRLMYYDGTETAEIEDTAAVYGLQIYGDYIYWMSDGSLKQMNIYSGNVINLMKKSDIYADNSIGADFKIVGNEDKTVVVWSSENGDTVGVFSRIIENGKLTCTFPGFTRKCEGLDGFAVAIDDEGNYEYLLNEMTDKEDICTLSYVKREVLDKIQIDEVIINDADRKNGKQPVSFKLTNVGEKNVSEFTVQITSGRIVYINSKLQNEIAPGETIRLSINLDMPQVTNLRDIKVSVYSEGQTIEDAVVKTVQIGKTDVTLSVAKNIIDNKAIFKYTLTNLTGTETDGRLDIYAPDGSGTVLKSFDFTELSSTASEFFTYEIDLEGIDTYGDKIYYPSVVTTTIPDYDMSNNETLGIIDAADIPVKHVHTIVMDEAVAPTCTKEGVKEGSHCSECGEIFKEQEVLPALGHKKVIDEKIEPTINSTGLTEGSHCSVCREILIKQEIIPKIEEETVVNPFTDIPSESWYTDAVIYVYKRKAMTGLNATTFAPMTKLSRAMTVTLLWKLEGEPKMQESVFPDVKATSWKGSAVAWAKKNGIVTGYSKGENAGLFKPDNNITRQDFIKILYEYAQWKGLDTSVKSATTYTEVEDYKDVFNYAKPSVNWGYEKGLIGNGSNLKPQMDITRREAAVIIARFLQLYKI